jgi:hypothetical protein
MLVVLLTVSTAFAENRDVIYVKADGSNNNGGFTEREPVQRLAFALNMAAQNPAVKKIVVIGTLNDRSEKTGYDVAVFAIGAAGAIDITISGKPNAAPYERAVLSSLGTGKAAVVVSRIAAVKLKIRFEHIEISGANRKSDGGGLIIRGGAEVFLGPGAKVINNRAANAAGVIVMANSSLVLDGGEIRGNTALETGGGVLVEASGGFTMLRGSITNNKGGGVLISETGVFTMMGGVIRNNVTADTGGGGVFVRGMFNWRNGEISENQTALGGNPAQREVLVEQNGMLRRGLE